jgi:hypothetical protein
LQEFFDVWGQTFTNQEILGHHGDADHEITMTVNGQPSTAFASLVLRDEDNIVIRLGDRPGTFNPATASKLPPDTPPTANSGCGSAASPDIVNSAQGVNDHSISSGSSFSAAGVRYFDGELKLVSTDLTSSGFHMPWGRTLSWTNMCSRSRP